MKKYNERIREVKAARAQEAEKFANEMEKLQRELEENATKKAAAAEGSAFDYEEYRTLETETKEIEAALKFVGSKLKRLHETPLISGEEEAAALFEIQNCIMAEYKNARDQYQNDLQNALKHLDKHAEKLSGLATLQRTYIKELAKDYNQAEFTRSVNDLQENIKGIMIKD